MKERIMRRVAEIDWQKEGGALLRDYALIVLGTLLVAMSFDFFFMPHDIAPGGVTGLATVLASYLPLGVGFLSFLINLPLFLLGAKHVGWRFAVRSFIAMTLLSVMIDCMPLADAAGDPMLAAIFGGVVMGVGLGLIVRAGATTGGTDMAAKLLHALLPFLTIASILLGVDGIVVLIAAARFGLSLGLWALVAVYVQAKTMDVVVKGVSTAMKFIIITSEPERIASRINGELERGCTRISAQGTYTGNDVGLLLCIISRLEAARLKKIVSECDPRAFVTVSDAHEVLGEGFTPMNEK